MPSHDDLRPAWAVVTGRMGSTRLCGKTMADIRGTPALGRIIARLRGVDGLDGVTVATTSAPVDDPIRACAAQAEVPVHSGSAADVLGRVLEAAELVGARTVVRVTGDCPLTDPGTVARALEAFRLTRPDCLSNVRSERPYPHGLDVEVVSIDTLRRVSAEATDPLDREHVTRYVYEHPDRFSVQLLDAPLALARPDLRLTVDTAEDLELVRQVYAELEPADAAFRAEHVIAWLDAHPEVAALNRHLIRSSPQ